MIMIICIICLVTGVALFVGGMFLFIDGERGGGCLTLWFGLCLTFISVVLFIQYRGEWITGTVIELHEFGGNVAETGTLEVEVKSAPSVKVGKTKEKREQILEPYEVAIRRDETGEVEVLRNTIEFPVKS